MQKTNTFLKMAQPLDRLGLVEKTEKVEMMVTIEYLIMVF